MNLPDARRQLDKAGFRQLPAEDWRDGKGRVHTVAYVDHLKHMADKLATENDEAAALLAQALANNPIRRDLIEQAYAKLKGIET